MYKWGLFLIASVISYWLWSEQQAFFATDPNPTINDDAGTLVLLPEDASKDEVLAQRHAKQQVCLDLYQELDQLTSNIQVQLVDNLGYGEQSHHVKDVMALITEHRAFPLTDHDPDQMPLSFHSLGRIVNLETIEQAIRQQDWQQVQFQLEALQNADVDHPMVRSAQQMVVSHLHQVPDSIRGELIVRLHISAESISGLLHGRMTLEDKQLLLEQVPTLEQGFVSVGTFNNLLYQSALHYGEHADRTFELILSNWRFDSESADYLSPATLFLCDETSIDELSSDFVNQRLASLLRAGDTLYIKLGQLYCSNASGVGHWLDLDGLSLDLPGVIDIESLDLPAQAQFISKQQQFSNQCATLFSGQHLRTLDQSDISDFMDDPSKASHLLLSERAFLAELKHFHDTGEKLGQEIDGGLQQKLLKTTLTQLFEYREQIPDYVFNTYFKLLAGQPSVKPMSEAHMMTLSAGLVASFHDNALLLAAQELDLNLFADEQGRDIGFYLVKEKRFDILSQLINQGSLQPLPADNGDKANQAQFILYYLSVGADIPTAIRDFYLGNSRFGQIEMELMRRLQLANPDSYHEIIKDFPELKPSVGTQATATLTWL